MFRAIKYWRFRKRFGYPSCEEVLDLVFDYFTQFNERELDVAAIYTSCHSLQRTAIELNVSQNYIRNTLNNMRRVKMFKKDEIPYIIGGLPL